MWHILQVENINDHMLCLCKRYEVPLSEVSMAKEIMMGKYWHEKLHLMELHIFYKGIACDH